MTYRHDIFLTLTTVAILASGCSDDIAGFQEYEESGLRVGIDPGTLNGKAIDIDEYRISDLNLFLFNEKGLLEDREYIVSTGNGIEPETFGWETDILKNGVYSIYVCANFGYEINAGTADGLADYRYHIAYPDECPGGIPMCGSIEHIRMDGSGEIIVPIERMMARIDITVDRSRLDDDVEFNVRRVSVCGCPKSCSPFSENVINDEFMFFPAGFTLSDNETDGLNIYGSGGRSRTVSLYQFENMQGNLLPGNKTESGKYFEEGNPAGKYCSYIEIHTEYLSDSHYSWPGKYLIYRLYPGLSPENFDVRRNTAYNILITPCGDGLGKCEWRIDDSGISEFAESVRLSSSFLDMSYLGEKRQLKAYIQPEGSLAEELAWESSDLSVASVDTDGTVRAVGEGECIVECRIGNSGITDKCKVSVKPGNPWMKIYPGNFIRCKTGETVEIRSEYFPPDAVFDIGLEELEYDKGRGLYDYTVGADGRSVILHIKQKGSGLLYFSAGPPVNQDEMIVIIVD